MMELASNQISLTLRKVENMSNSKNPEITPSENGPYQVKGLANLVNQKGPLSTKENIALCRCGGSANKPFCDGTHAYNGFSSAKLEGRIEDKLDHYKGKNITIHDNRGICEHAGRCTDGLAAVFHLREEPWIFPDAATTEEIISTIKKCPSGALSYTSGDEKGYTGNGEPTFFIAPNGPYVVTGGPELKNTTRGDGASREHFTMCRCGGSKNKPFCDGSHIKINFEDGQST